MDQRPLLSSVGSGAKLQSQTILVLFENLETLLMHMICPSVPISASTELTKFLHSKKITAPPFGAPSAVARGHIPPSAALPAATVSS